MKDLVFLIEQELLLLLPLSKHLALQPIQTKRMSLVAVNQEERDKNIERKFKKMKNYDLERLMGFILMEERMLPS